MDKKLSAYLESLGFDDEDIENFELICPELEHVDANSALSCVKAVVDAGFPDYDIDGLIFSNPALLTNNPEQLKKKLASIKGDIETVLKENPELI